MDNLSSLSPNLHLTGDAPSAACVLSRRDTSVTSAILLLTSFTLSATLPTLLLHLWHFPARSANRKLVQNTQNLETFIGHIVTVHDLNWQGDVID